MNYNKPEVNCCNYGKFYIEATFYNISEEDYEDEDCYKKNKPVWIIRKSECDYNNLHSVESMKKVRKTGRYIKYCPRCGKKLPDFKLKKNLRPVFHVPKYAGEYCDRCDERSMCCKCEHPIKMWKVKKINR